MPSFWLANADPATAWAHQAWSDLAARTDRAHTLVVLPVHGFADHGLGLPLETEEIVGSTLLRAAIGAIAPGLPVLSLPPLRWVTAPYAHTFFGLDAETALETLMEIAESVKNAGFAKLLFFNTSPWNGELVATAALDARIRFDLQTYAISSSGLGLGFHPTDINRPRTQAVAAHLLDRHPALPGKPADIRDPDFRPGHYIQPAPVAFDATLDGLSLATNAANQLAELLREVSAHRSPLPTVAKPPLPGALIERPLPKTAQVRHLAACTAEELENIPDKAKALVIIPTGSIEQHGHHLPLGTDAILGQLWLAHALPKLPINAPVLVAPPLTYGKSNEHAGFAGTLTISARSLRRQLLALAGNLKALGFTQLAVLNTHGGNSAVLVTTLREIQVSLGLRAGLLNGYYKPVQEPQESAYGFHAGEWETSLMLAAAPELVRMDRAVCEYPARLDAPGQLRPEASAAVFAWKTADISKSGVMGDATRATAEKGSRWLEEASSALARKILTLL